MAEHWSPDLCSHAYFAVQVRPRAYFGNDDDPYAGAGELVSEDPIRGQDRYCRYHWGGRFQIAEHGGAVPTHCVQVAAEQPATYAGFGFIDPDTGGYRVISPTQNPPVYEARYGTTPGGPPI
jgi:hypothetical protein